jgi:hypothetical protein
VWLAVAVSGTADAAPVLLENFGSFSHPSGISVEEGSGNAFVADGGAANAIDVFGPLGEAASGVAAPATIEGFAFNNEPSGLAVDNAASSPSEGALYVADVAHNAVKKYVLEPLSEEYELKEELSATPGFGEPLGVAVDASGNVFVADYGSSSVVKFSPTGTELLRIDVSGSVEHPSSVALDSAGDLFVQGYSNGRAYKYAANGSGEIEPSAVPTEIASGGATGVAVDRSTNAVYIALGSHVTRYDASSLSLEEEIGAGVLGATERVAVNAATERVYVADLGKKDVAVFGPLPPPVAPEVLTETAVATPTEAELKARIFPGNEEAGYRFEFGTTEAYGRSTSEKTTAAVTHPVDVSASAFGLVPGTTYHYRAVVRNSVETVFGPDRTFATPTGGGLPDGRAYELVSPADANGLFLKTQTEGDDFDTPLATADGESVIFNTHGLLPGTEGNGTVDAYESVRSPSGWTTSPVEPTGAQAVAPTQGGTSADHKYSFWKVQPRGGSLDIGGGNVTHYIRNTETGGYELVGLGSLGQDPRARGVWISPGANHIVFITESGISVPLEPNAPPEGVAAIYDRSPGGPTHVISLLPGDAQVTSDAEYLGTSEGGSGVVFGVEGTLYERRNDSETLEVAAGGPTYEGVSRDGSRVFYLKEGNAFAFDANSKTAIPIGSGGESTVVNVSADGSHVYFASPLQLDGSKGEPGKPNLYVWDGSAVGFVATLDPLDFAEFGGSSLVSLSKWPLAIGPEQTALTGRANDPSRTTPDGSVLLFQSHAVSGYPYDSEGHSEIYRFDAGSEGVVCLSCSLSESPATSEAELESTALTTLNAPTAPTSRIQNVTDDGSTVFFTTADPLLPADTDGVKDVYEWKGGNLSLISSGRSTLPNFLTGMSSDGRDVFFKTSDTLVPQDENGGSGSIYDARIGGGFPQPQSSPPPCSEDSCQGGGSPPPLLPTSGSADVNGPPNPKPRHHRKNHKKHHRKHHHRRAGHRRGGAR